MTNRPLRPRYTDFSGPCPTHITGSVPVRFYLDPEPCYGCHPELLEVADPRTVSAAWAGAIAETRTAWRLYLTGR